MKRAECNQCPKTFCNKQLLRIHTNRIHLKIPNQIQCKDCDKKFANKWNLKLHRGMAHDKSSHVQCPICNKTLVSGDKYLLKHIQIHETEDMPKEEKDQVLAGRNAQCPICKKVLSCEEYVKLHVKTVHDKSPSGGKKVQCDICKKSLSCKQYLKLHVKTVHRTPEEQDLMKESEKVKCPICAKTLCSKQYIKVHIKKVHETLKKKQKRKRKQKANDENDASEV